MRGLVLAFLTGVTISLTSTNLTNSIRFDSISTNSEKIETRTGVLSLTEDLDIHVCWCYGVKVKRYNKIMSKPLRVMEWNLSPVGNDLVISDINNTVYSYYHFDEDYTYSITKDRTQTLRFKDYSVYFWNDNRIQLTNSSETILLRDSDLTLTNRIYPSKYLTLEELHTLLELNSSILLIKELELID